MNQTNSTFLSLSDESIPVYLTESELKWLNIHLAQYLIDENRRIKNIKEMKLPNDSLYLTHHQKEVTIANSIRNKLNPL